MEENLCQACDEPIDYCQGHGEIGDPFGAAILAAEDRIIRMRAFLDEWLAGDVEKTANLSRAAVIRHLYGLAVL